MKLREMDTFTSHLEKYFEQKVGTILHDETMKPHIDVLVFEPTEKYPFWKLSTMGASDYKMPKIKNTLGNRNEYMIFVDKNEDLSSKETVIKYRNYLIYVALYSYNCKTHVTYAHSLEWEADKDFNMVGAFLEMPQVIENARILRCKIGLFKEVVCLQVVLLTRDEIDKLLEIGNQKFDEYLYPESGKSHFLCELNRSDNF